MTVTQVAEGFTRTVMPNGSEVFYRDTDHSYWRGTKPNGSGTGRLTGVSTVCQPLDFRPDSLLRWVERLTLEGVTRGFQGATIPDDPHVLRWHLENHGLRWEQIRDSAAERGTNVHKEMLHALAFGEDAPDLAALPEDQRGYGQAVMAWWLERDPEVLQAEQVVCDLNAGFAGRLDLRCRIGRETVIVDAKTGRFIPLKAHAQLAGYDLGCVRSGFGPADRLLVLQVCPDGTYREIPGQADHSDFLAAMDVYRRAGRLQNALRREAA